MTSRTAMRGILRNARRGSLLLLVGSSLLAVTSWAERNARPPTFQPGGSEQPRLVEPTPTSINETLTVSISIEGVVRRSVRCAGPVRTVTAIGTEDDYSSGDVLASLDDAALVAFAGDAPLTRDLGPTTVGPDVVRLSVFLADLGYYPGTSTDRMTPDLRLAVRDFNAHYGHQADSDTLRAATLAWVGPLPSVHLVPALNIGDRVGDGETIFDGPVITARAHVEESPDSSDEVPTGETLVGAINDIVIRYSAGSLSLDPITAVELAGLGQTFTVTVRGENPVDGSGVPIGAIITDHLGSCVVIDLAGTTARVDVLASDVGVALLAAPAPDRVVANPWTLGAVSTCPQH